MSGDSVGMPARDIFHKAVKHALIVDGQVDMEPISDLAHDRYQLLTVGWNGYERIHGCLFHIDIKEEKIWIQHDGTEEGLAYRLVERGVPKTDIVLAFHAPFRRQFTEFAPE